MSLVLTRSVSLRLGGFAALYFAQGVPIGLLSVAVPAWLAERGASVGDIAMFTGIVTSPWAGKLLVGPLMDRFGFPPMGFRRPWVILAQGGLVLSFLGLAACASLLGDAGDERFLTGLIAVGFVINVFAASQDVAVDGMAIDVLPVRERGRANAFMAFGQVAGYSLYGYLCAVVLTRHGLGAAALLCAATVAGIFAFATAVRERPGERMLPWTAGEATVRPEVARRSLMAIARDLFPALLLPMSLVLVAVEFINRVRDGIAIAVFPKFAVELGFTAEQYTAFNSWAGLAAAFIGAALGPFIDKVGAYRFLAGALIASAICHLVVGLAQPLWENTESLLAMAALATIASQIIFVAIIALFMNLCWPRVGATQFAIYMSLANLSRSIGGMAFAPVADDLSFAQDFLIMGALLLIAAGVLRFFDPAAHAERLELLQAQAAKT